MRSKSEKSMELYKLMIERGYPEAFADEVTKNLNTDFTAKRMIGYLLRQKKMLPLEIIVDEMLAILSDRNQIMQKKQLESSNASYNEYLNRDRSEKEDAGIETDLYIKQALIRWDQVPLESYVRKIDAVKNLQEITFHKPVTFLVGENGSGKSTILEAIAVAAGFNPEGGTKNYRFSTHDSHSELHEAVKLVKGISRPGWGYFLRAESFYNVASQEEEYAQWIDPSKAEELHKKSHGESFLFVAQNHFKSHGLYFLDEPEAALSPQRQLTLLMEIDRCAKENSQFVIVTHSPILLGLPDAEILSFDGGRVQPCSYEDTESYQVTEMFINNRKQLLYKLLD